MTTRRSGRPRKGEPRTVARLLGGTRQPVDLLDALAAKRERLGLTTTEAVEQALRAWVAE